MESLLPKSKNSNQLLCEVRKEWVIATPEEKVRQKIVGHLLRDLHFPVATLAVEKGLGPLSEKKSPERRVDIITYINRNETLEPLLLIECKAIKLSPKVVTQVVGYNAHLRAPFIAVANEEEIQMGWFDAAQQGYKFIPYIPLYDQLRRSLDPDRSSLALL